MQKIRYKSKKSKYFEIYIDIGACERDMNIIKFYLPDNEETNSPSINISSYTAWFENFKLESIGVKMIILNFYLAEYMGWNIGKDIPQIDYFRNQYGEKITNIITSNFNYFLNFNEKWFDEKSSLFKGLDLSSDDIEDRFARTKETEEGDISEIEFDDGSIIQFINEDDSLRSFYVPEIEYLNLKNEIQDITNKFRP